MALTDTISALFRRLSRSGQTADTAVAASPVTTLDDTPQPLRIGWTQSSPFRVDRSRKAIVEECRRLYEHDPRIRRILKSVSADVVKGGYTVTVRNDRRAEEIAAAQEQRLKLTSRLDDWTRLCFIDGDLFLEIGVSQVGQIAAITRKPTLEMVRNSNHIDMFDDPERAFYWVGDAGEFAYGNEPPRGAVPLRQWQIIHARWDHDDGRRYGTPMFQTAVQTAKYVSDGEKNMAIRRLVRSGLRYAHRVEGSQQEVERYRKANQDALLDPYAAVTDFFGNSTITRLDGDANLAQYDDVMHHVRTLGLASPIALGLLGYGQDLNRDVLDEQQQQYERTLESMTEWLQAQIVEPLLHLEWMLHGIYPDGIDYEIVWKAKQPFTAANLKLAAEAGLALQTLGYDPETVHAMLTRFMPGLAAIAPAPPTPMETSPASIAAALGAP
jgi:hypothetical protein